MDWVMLETVPEAPASVRVLWRKTSWIAVAGFGGYGPRAQQEAMMQDKMYRRFIEQHGFGEPL